MSHYFSARPDSPERRSKLTIELWGVKRTFETASGVFSADHLDKATALLLEHFEPPEAEAIVLDLGCGWGPIACALAGAGAVTWAVDINARALELTTANAERHGLQVRAVLPEAVPPELLFDEIWSNPPIRIGKQALHDLMLTWMPRLKPSGVAKLVVGKNLGADSLQAWLIAQGFAVQREASAKGFRLLSVRHG